MRRVVPTQPLGFVLLVAVCLLATGCGPKKNEVTISGKVTVEGDPIDTGSIMFTAADGGTYVAGGVIEDGQYKASVPPGDKIVQIRGLKKIGQREVFDEVSGKKFPTDSHVRMTPPAYEAADSPLRAKVTKDGEVFDFQLSKKYSKDKR